MGLPESLVKRLEERAAQGLPVGFSPWADLEGRLWGYIKKIGPTSIEFDLVSVDGSYDETSSYSYSRIYHFDFSVHYATRLKRLGERIWPQGKGYVVRKASIRDEILEKALSTGNPIHFRNADASYFSDAKVIQIDGDWITLQRLEDDGTLRDPIEVTRRSKIYLKAGPFNEAVAWLAST